MCKLLFQTKLTEKVGLYTEENMVKDIQLERVTNQARTGSIYLGKVRNVDQSIEAAFIEIEKNVVGFLAKKEFPFDGELSSSLTEGSSVIVQVIKEAYQDKGPRLTANITFPGNSMVYLPYSGYIACSKKLSEHERVRMESIFQPLLTEQEGLIIRTKSVEITEMDLREQLDKLRQTYEEIKSMASHKKAPCPLLLLHQIPDQMLNQYQSMPLTEIIFDQFEEMKKMERNFPQLADRMIYKQTVHSPDNKTIDQLLEESIQPAVRTKEGIMLTIEQTEGLTVIDIDSSQYKSRQNKGTTLFHINRKAIRPIAAEIRKRNLSGIILIDFLKMKNREEQQQIRKWLCKELEKDVIRTEVYGFTRLGLLEMARKREHVSLLQLLTDRSSTVHDVKNLESYAYQLERQLYAWNGTKTEAIIIAGSAEFLRFFRENIRPNIQGIITFDVYHFTDDQTLHYRIVRTGSVEIIEEYISQHKDLVIDKLL
ncbi:ribonuclease G [Gracilibacillus ureilyticus]|uniref:Ribonuclease G n=1 Tax=Gracilibacillus ureilyticus TaxID=531814 RepID=A0A1H9RP98_9BACI|nr:ribonuclease E/G [Gracilibacillus ureilyticus]SER74566.1 ribonuclease G [Gracilibacillus ureilyticus]